MKAAKKMSAADKRAAWRHIRQHSSHTESFIRELKKTFGNIELVSYEKTAPKPRES